MGIGSGKGKTWVRGGQPPQSHLLFRSRRNLFSVPILHVGVVLRLLSLRFPSIGGASSGCRTYSLRIHEISLGISESKGYTFQLWRICYWHHKLHISVGFDR